MSVFCCICDTTIADINIPYADMDGSELEKAQSELKDDFIDLAKRCNTMNDIDRQVYAASESFLEKSIVNLKSFKKGRAMVFS